MLKKLLTKSNCPDKTTTHVPYYTRVSYEWSIGIIESHVMQTSDNIIYHTYQMANTYMPTPFWTSENTDSIFSLATVFPAYRGVLP